MRPIVSSIGSVTYNLAKYATKVLSPLVGKTPHHIKNSQAFVDTIKDIKLKDNEIITSYDVSALFTSIPPEDVLNVATEALENDPSLSDRTSLSVEQLSELISICLNTAYFSYKGQYYKQTHGCVMGSPLSPVGIDLRMEKFEQDILSSYPGIPPRLWLRYVDDTFVILDSNEQDSFFEYINQRDPHIKFTQEACKDNQLAFLDCLVKINPDNTLSSSVYRKPTHTDQYLQFGSNHPLVHKLGVIRTLNYRAETIISEQSKIGEEKAHIRSALEKCGYPDWSFEKAIKSSSPQSKINVASTTTKARVTIPYSAGLSEKIKNTYKSFAIAASYKPVNNLRSKLVHVKDKTPRDKQCNVVYGLKCSDAGCDESYVGETKQSIKARFNQHRRGSSKENQDSAVFTHSKHSGHQFNSDDIIILDKEEKWFERGVKEAIWERVEKPSLNKKGGLRVLLSHAWDPILKQLPRRMSHDQTDPQSSAQSDEGPAIGSQRH